MKTWFITGASRGFGLLIAKAALDAGDNVVATARQPRAVVDAVGAHARLLALALDVTDEQAAIQASCETRRLWGQQAQAFSAAALPLCRAV